MDKKKTGLTDVISIGLVIILGICFLRFWGQDRQDTLLFLFERNHPTVVEV